MNVTLTAGRCQNPNSTHIFSDTISNEVIQVQSSASFKSPCTTQEITQIARFDLNGVSLINQPFGPIIMKTDNSVNQFMFRLGANPTTHFSSCINHSSGYDMSTTCTFVNHT